MQSGHWCHGLSVQQTMIGEITLRQMEKYLQKKFGLGIFRFKVTGESFKFGDSEIVDVVEKCVIPIGILGFSGELEASIIPDADTPLLIAKDDLTALGTFIGFGCHKAMHSKISREVVDLRETPSGHYELPASQHLEGGGHTTPYEE